MLQPFTFDNFQSEHPVSSDYLINNSCFSGAHRYELVVKRAFKAHVPNNAYFETCINRFATFYNVVNHKVIMILMSLIPLMILRRFFLSKKWSHLVEMEEEQGLKKHLKLLKLFSVRWATSNLRALQVSIANLLIWLNGSYVICNMIIVTFAEAHEKVSISCRSPEGSTGG